MNKTGKIIFGLIFFLLFLVMGLSLISYSPLDGPETMTFPQTERPHNWCGRPGVFFSSTLMNFFGLGAWFLLFAVFVAFVFYWTRYGLNQTILRTLGTIFMMTAVCGATTFLVRDTTPGPTIGPGGYLGAIMRIFLDWFFAPLGSYIFLTSLFIAGIILAFDTSVVRILLWVSGIRIISEIILSPWRIRGKEPVMEKESADPVTSTPSPTPSSSDAYISGSQPIIPSISISSDTVSTEESNNEMKEEALEYEEYEETEDEVAETEEDAEQYPVMFVGRDSDKKGHGETARENVPAEDNTPEYEFPPLDLLPEGEVPDYQKMEERIRLRGLMLEKAFADFGIKVQVVETQTGPVLTMYEIALARGLRVKQISSLSNDLAISLKVPSVRIVAPIPGKNTVGVEIPNSDRQLVRLRDLMVESATQIEKMQVPVFLGRDVSGDPLVVDLTKMPHLLIAGRTGTGKSVCLNSIIMSILMTRSPMEVRLILIDPKMVELSLYRSVPHLMHPVVTDMKKAEALLAWAVDKMEERYSLLARAGVRQLSEYNRLSQKELYRRTKPVSTDDWDSIPKNMSSIIIVADEMADLIMTSGKDVENHIIRLAQKSRAVGIHLVLATQKPTVDIITGLIKSNLPARIAFGVASRTDSQVVLDCKGAEQLLGNGDMLFLIPGTSQVVRGQGTFISDQEINDIVGQIGTEQPEYQIDEFDLMPQSEGELPEVERERDELYDACIEAVFQEHKGSTSYLQRRFSIGYNRAARIIDWMVVDGILAEQDKNKTSAPREILLTAAQWQQKKEAASQSAKKEEEPVRTFGGTSMLKPEKLIPFPTDRILPARPVLDTSVAEDGPAPRLRFPKTKYSLETPASSESASDNADDEYVDLDNASLDWEDNEDENEYEDEFDDSSEDQDYGEEDEFEEDVDYSDDGDFENDESEEDVSDEEVWDEDETENEEDVKNTSPPWDEDRWNNYIDSWEEGKNTSDTKVTGNSHTGANNVDDNESDAAEQNEDDGSDSSQSVSLRDIARDRRNRRKKKNRKKKKHR